MSLGFSIYFGLDNTMEENLQLLKDGKNLGFTRIFTSLHIPEADYSILKSQVKEFFKIAKEYDMDIISDISPNTFKFLNLDNMDLKGLSEIGVKTIRVDFGYNEEEIAKMSRNPYGIKVQLNGSTVTEEFLLKLDKLEVEYKNIDALHNFYPRAGTGISIEYMEKQNKLLSKRGIKVSSFIQSNNRKRGPIKEGLPTLENHRNLDVRIAANELFALGNETVFIGDSLPSIQELKELSLLKQDEIMLDIEVMVKDDIINRLLKETYTPRVDQARDAIRAVESRYNLNGDIIIPMNTIDSEIGYITIDNIEYGRYMGELQILKVNKKKDYRINVVAKVSENSLHLLRYIDEGKKFSFYNKEF
ncbi:MAG: MupG family TIM beta-alpha barrel fold protein [Clostridium sp.]|nr:MupG family TIM beta-alpha barrel fold protein [Clostridium sp.]MDY3360637.1 MupG family TIM beta-alpha barrel fold protein [Clostridium celatum]